MQLAAETTFGNAVRLLAGCTGVQTSGATARRRTYVAGEAALAVEERARAALVADPPPVRRTAECLQLSIDATKVPLVGGEWTDVKLASVAQVVSGRAQDGTPRAHAVAVTYAARWETATQFGQTLTRETQRRNLDGAACVVSPHDGAPWIQEIVDLLAPQAVRILDEPHAAEHLGTISQVACGPTSLRASDWVARQRATLLAGPDGPARVLTELDRLLAVGPHPAAPRTAEDPDPAAVLARAVAYFQKRKDQIRYWAFRQDGYPIGSGCVESGHRVIITPRCKRAGMRWAPAHLTPLLVLRTIEANDRWEATWPAIWQELQTSTSRQRQGAQQHRRPLRLRQTSTLPPDQAVAAPSAHAASLALAPPGTPPPTTQPPAPRGVPRRRPAPRPPRPAADHPWRRPFTLPRPHQVY